MKLALRVILCDVVCHYGSDVAAHPQRLRGRLLVFQQAGSRACGFPVREKAELQG